MIGLLDCGVGNINSFYFFYLENNIKIKIIKSLDEITKDINKIILVGVSSFDTMMRALNNLNFDDFLKKFVQNQNNKFLGICCGMQVLGNSSDEGKLAGLGLVQGKNSLIKSKIKPHLGWNNLLINNNLENKLLSNVEKKDLFYFLHSYYFDIVDPAADIIFADYDNFSIPSIVAKNNIYGVQFHPEKSHDSGKKILLNFYNL